MDVASDSPVTVYSTRPDGSASAISYQTASGSFCTVQPFEENEPPIDPRPGNVGAVRGSLMYSTARALAGAKAAAATAIARKRLIPSKLRQPPGVCIRGQVRPYVSERRHRGVSYLLPWLFAILAP